MCRKLIALLLFIVTIQVTKAQNEFITVWKPGNVQPYAYDGIPVNSTGNQIWLPTEGINYQITWEEIGYPSHTGILSGVISGYHILVDFGTSLNPDPANATYRVKVESGSGSFHRIRFTDWDLFPVGNGIIGDSHKILLVEQWGETQWSSMRQAFQGCNLMNITATDLPRLASVSDFSFMFTNCSSLTGNPTINDWNISSVTNLQSTFQGCFLFNQPVGNWDTSNVVNMGTTFLMAQKFNQPLAGWNTSNVETMTAMFNNAREFNQPIGNWDLSENLDCEFMFSNAWKFNQPIGNWNTSKVVEMNSMFSNAKVFNQNIGSWNTSEVLYMQNMFFNATAFNQNIGNWNTSKVTSMNQMFSNATSFNQNIGNWNTSHVSSMGNMFSNASAFNQNLGNWNLNDLTFASGMFSNSGMNCQNYDNTLIGWSQKPSTPNSIFLSPVAPLAYSDPAAISARNYLITVKNWTISGDIYNGECHTVLGTSDAITQSEETIYPNPATDFIFVRNSEAKNFTIFDQSGRTVLKGMLNDGKIDIRNLVSGNYILQLISDKNSRNLKLIKQ